jgi:hypothetical protein
MKPIFGKPVMSCIYKKDDILFFQTVAGGYVISCYCFRVGRFVRYPALWELWTFSVNIFGTRVQAVNDWEGEKP